MRRIKSETKQHEVQQDDYKKLSNGEIMGSNKKGNMKNVKKKATVCLPSNNLSRKVHNIGICNKSHGRLKHVPLLLYEADVEQMRKRKRERCEYGMQQPNLFYK